MTFMPNSGSFGPGNDPNKPNVATQSGERAAMQGDLDLIADIRAGAEAIRKNSSRYLPQYEKEDRGDYRRRVNSAPWRPEFVDALSVLASKPFSKPVTLGASTSPGIAKLAENIDGQGNNLHVFARQTFLEAIANGVALISVDFPRKTWGPSLADQKAANPRPYWISIPIQDVIAIYGEMRNGRLAITHLRIREWTVERDGWGETVSERVRVMEPGTWELWEKQKSNTQSRLEEWIKIDDGALAFAGGKTPDEVPVALIFTGERRGTVGVKPPLRDLADMQIELFRALSLQSEVLTYAGSPMLAGTGMNTESKNTEVVTVGPKTVLFAPADGGWSYVQPDAANIKELREHVASVTDEFRHLAMQPTVVKSSGVAATTTMVDAAKAHSQLEAWALALKDGLERAFTFTEMWLGEKRATTVNVNTDFSASDGSNNAVVIVSAADKAIISKRTARAELQRRNIIGSSVDLDAEDELIALEQQGLEPEFPMDPINGNVIPFNGEQVA